MARGTEPNVDAAMAWASDIIRTADDLGYAVMTLAPTEVKVVPARGGKMQPTVTLAGCFIDGVAMRRVLAPIPPEGTPE